MGTRMKPAAVTPLVEQLAAHNGLGYPQAGYLLDSPRPASAAFGFLMACFWVAVGVGGLVLFGPTLLQELANRASGRSTDTQAAMLFAGVALACLLLGLYLFSGVRGAFHRVEWYLCPAGFIVMVDGKGEAVRWDRVEEFKWTTKPDNEHQGWMYRFRRADGKKFGIYWSGDIDEYVNLGYEFDLAIVQAHR